jgi:hypothetical protein
MRTRRYPGIRTGSRSCGPVLLSDVPEQSGHQPEAVTDDWVLRFAPDAGQLAAFRGGNAQRLFFARPLIVRPISPEWDLLALQRRADAWLFPPNLDLSEEQHRRLMDAYKAWGGESHGLYSQRFLALTERRLQASKSAAPALGL